jgi:hypothetical protein
VLIPPEAGGFVGLILLYKYLYKCGYFDVHSLTASLNRQQTNNNGDA